MRKFLYVFFPLFVGLALRLYPHSISGLPFSTDAWPLVRNTELLLEHTPIPLNDEVFDGYNNYYPANTIFGALMAQVISVKAIETMAIFLPVTGATSILIFYVLVKKFHGDRTGFIASLMFAGAYTHAIFTAGVTKETYGNPLYISLIFIFVHPKMGVSGRSLLFVVTSLALVLTHHVTSLIAIIVLLAVALAEFVNSQSPSVTLQMSRLVLPLIHIIATVLYYVFYVSRGFKVPLTLSDWLSVASYQVVTFALALYFSSEPSRHSFRRVIVECFTALTVTCLIAMFTTNRPLVPGAPVLPIRYLLYESPFIIVSPLIVLGYERLNGMRGNKYPYIFFWLAAVLGLEGYAVFSSSSLQLGLAYRNVNFLYPPLLVLTAIGLDGFYETSERSCARKFLKMVSTVTLLAIMILNCYTVYAAVSLQERYMGYFWLYRIQEYEAAAWAVLFLNEQHVTGDVKASYLLKGYFDTEVDTLQGLGYLMGKDASKPAVLFLYSQMLENGYVLYGGYSVDLPRDWTERTSYLNLIYSNGLVNISG